MKTVLVIYTHEVLTKKEHQTLKRYAFNTRSKIKIGDHIELDLYDTPVQVVEVLPKVYKYYNHRTGDLSNKRVASSVQNELREFKVVNQRNEALIEGVKLN